MRTGVVFLLVVCTLGTAAATALGADTGRSRPPTQLSDDNKAVWMTEWVACRHKRLSALAREIGVKIPPGRAPQVAAVLIAKKAEAPLYEYDQIAIAIDGCRNGILWRYYHESPQRSSAA